MRIKNNKGFTLVELIIAMTILSIVLALGYRVIIGTNKATKNQTEVFSEQQNANLVNMYLTKDLEQVRKFTTADTSVNPYTYIINDGVQGIEKIEYEVKKTDDGKLYTVTRKANGGSIDLISNYKTTSEVPFSINLVENTENLFKVSLDGESKKNKISKYEFNISSRVQNDVALVETPITSGGSKPGGGQNPPSATQTEVSRSGEIRFEYSTHGNTRTIYLKAKGIEKIKTNNDIKTNTTYHELEKGFDKNTNQYIIDAKIPIKSNTLKVALCNTTETEVLGSKTLPFTKDGNEWDMFKNEITNNKVYIYASDNITITELIVGSGTHNLDSNNACTLDIKNLNIQENMVNVKLKINLPKQGNANGFISIGFGDYKQEDFKTE